MPTEQHTPTPWKLSEQPHRIIGECGLIAECSRPEPNWQANAQFIVAACNSHEALLAENKELRESVKDLVIILEAKDSISPLETQMLVCARAALAKGGK